MKILFISYYYAPANTIAAVRTTKIVKYLERLGNTVDVVAGDFGITDEILLNDIKNKKNIKYIKCNKIFENIRTIKNIKNNKQSNKKNLVTYFVKYINRLFGYIFGLQKWIVFDFLNSFFWYVKAKKQIKNYSYDYVIASYGPIGTLLLAKYIKLKNKKLKLIIDIRDAIVPEYVHNSVLKIVLTNIQRKILRISDCAVVVSHGLKNYLMKNNYKNDVFVITNGFDEEDLLYIQQEKTKSHIDCNEFVFCYAGTLYEGKSDLSPLFLVLSKLSAEKKIDLKKIKVIYAGKDTEIAKRFAEKYYLKNILRCKGYLPRNELLSILESSDILVMATWNSKNEQGILTGKFFEYLMFKKPIMSLISGEGGAEIEEIIKEINCGFVFYNDLDNIENLKEYILDLYTKKIDKHIEIKNTYNENINRYNYCELGKKYNTIIIEEL